MDSRIGNPDQRLTQDIEKWASSLSSLYSNLSKPILDIILFSRKLSELVVSHYSSFFRDGKDLHQSWSGISFQELLFDMFHHHSENLLRLSKVTSFVELLGYEGEYRSCHTDLLNHSEEIAFYKGNGWEAKKIDQSFTKLVTHIKSVLFKKLFMGVFDSMLVKYGAVMVGYAVLGLPVFGPGKEKYFAKVGNDEATITRDYVRNSSLLINLAKAIGRVVVSYKEVQNLAGYTSLVYELKEVLEDLDEGKYQKTLATNSVLKSADQRGELTEGENIVFDKVPVISPNGDLLINDVSFNIKPGMNVMISGPNGCGKSSLFRILGGLWPLFGGKVEKPARAKVFYIPQRPYLPPGKLRDQIIYPHTKLEMLKNKKLTDKGLVKILEKVHLAYLVEREGGWDTENDWNDVLSGGEKQRMAMARLIYHKPTYAILGKNNV